MTTAFAADDYHRKIVDVDRLEHVLTRLRHGADNGSQSKTIVQCHGCFDIVHPGHIRYLRFARTQGNVLVVSITGDAQINKGDQRPYIPQELRAENLAALELVDYVVIDPNPTACALLARIRPDVYVKGREYATSRDPRFLAERQVVESSGGRVIFSSGQVVFSSSRLIESLAPGPDLTEQRLRSLCGRHGVTRAALRDMLNAMRGRRVVVVGDTLVERYVLCDATDIAGEAPMMSLEQLDDRDYLGGAAFVAAQLAGLGARPVLITALGEDAMSKWAVATLADAGVEVRGLRSGPDTALKTRFLVDDHKLFKVSRTSVRPLDSLGESEAVRIVRHESAAADAAILFDSGYGTMTPGLLRRLKEWLPERVRTLTGGASEPKGKPSSLRHVDVLCSSERQLRAAMNDFEGGLSAVAYRMLQETHAKGMLVMLGKRGLVVFDRRSHDPQSAEWTDRLSSEHLPTFTSRPVDQLGEIESLLAASTLALAGGAGLMRAAFLGAALAAIQTSQPGLSTVSADIVRDWADRHAEHIAPDRLLDRELDR
ncbi:MAG: PfkB family carbohydrate kinase, partial [Phycisphaerae bacterium]